MSFEVGLLWLMDQKVSLDVNVAHALSWHFHKYGVEATVINANPEDLAEARVIGGVLAVPEKSCLKGNLFVGRKSARVRELGKH